VDRGLAFSPDKLFLYVSVYDQPTPDTPAAGNQVLVIDTQANTVIDSVAVGTRPYGAG